MCKGFDGIFSDVKFRVCDSWYCLIKIVKNGIMLMIKIVFVIKINRKECFKK